MQPDPGRAADFYAALFEWTFTDPGPGGYRVARRNGSDVAGLAPFAQGAFWNTYIRVDDVDATAQRASAAGGEILDGPLDASPAGRALVLRDPAGAAVCAWEAGARLGAQLVNEPGTWSMSALHTPDAAVAGAFYSAVFGWELETAGALVLCRLPGYEGDEPDSPMPRDTVAVIASHPGDSVPPHWAVSFRVADVGAVVERALMLGGSVVVPPLEGAYGLCSAALCDPQGAVFTVAG